MGEARWVRELRKFPGGARVIAKYQRPPVEGAMTRLPDFIHVTGNEYFALDKPKPRAVVKCVGPGDIVAWWYCDPIGHWGRVSEEHSLRAVEEHDDGTVTLYQAAVFQNVGPYEPWWRGTLIEGVWTGVPIVVEGSHAAS